MRFKELLSEDDAVSPVIGVILMVAITVILAAVIASFVLGLGDTADEVQPTTSFEVDWDYESGSNDILEITVTDGDGVDPSNMWVRGTIATGEDVDETWDEIDGLTNMDATLDSTDELSAGQGIEIEFTNGQDVREHDFDIVWDTGDDSATLDSAEGPEA